MYNTITMLLRSAFFSLFLLSCLAHAKQQPSQADLDKLVNDIRAAQQRISSNQGEAGNIQKALQQTEKELGRIERQTLTLKKQINEQQQQLEKMQAQQAALDKDKHDQEQQIIEQINASYRLGREKKIKILLNQEDPQKLSRSLIYTDYFNRARLETIEAYQKTIRDIEELKPAIENKTSALLKNKDALVLQQKKLKASYKDRSNTLAKLNSSIKSDESRLKQLKIEQEQLQDLLQAVETTIDAIKLPSDSVRFAATQGKLPWPSRGQLKNRFGQKRPPSNLNWEGVSFYTNSGNDVKAVHHGRVVFADWFRGKGLLLIIDHGDGYMTLYAHNQTLLRETGDWVSAGETIATVGNSGGLDHTELYFEIRHQGKPLNPKYWLKKQS